MNNTQRFSHIGIASAALSLTSLALLHGLSADIDPTWHMVSEYAYGQYGWLLSVFFFAWAVSYWTTALALIPLTKGWLARLGIFLLLLSGVGALMGGLFDVRHNLHGLAFGLGIPFLPVVAPLLTRHLQKKYKMKDRHTFLTAQTTWISFILMAASMALFISQMQKVGAMNMSTPQFISILPQGVTPIIGYTNRFLVLSYVGWLLAINLFLLKLKRK